MGMALQQNASPLRSAELLVRRCQIAGHVNFGIAATTETIFDVIASINPALEKFQFTHRLDISNALSYVISDMADSNALQAFGS